MVDSLAEVCWSEDQCLERVGTELALWEELYKDPLAKKVDFKVPLVVVRLLEDRAAYARGKDASLQHSVETMLADLESRAADEWACVESDMNTHTLNGLPYFVWHATPSLLYKLERLKEVTSEELKQRQLGVYGVRSSGKTHEVEVCMTHDRSSLFVGWNYTFSEGPHSSVRITLEKNQIKEVLLNNQNTSLGKSLAVLYDKTSTDASHFINYIKHSNLSQDHKTHFQGLLDLFRKVG